MFCEKEPESQITCQLKLIDHYLQKAHSVLEYNDTVIQNAVKYVSSYNYNGRYQQIFKTRIIMREIEKFPVEQKQKIIKLLKDMIKSSIVFTDKIVLA